MRLSIQLLFLSLCFLLPSCLARSDVVKQNIEITHSNSKSIIEIWEFLNEENDSPVLPFQIKKAKEVEKKAAKLEEEDPSAFNSVVNKSLGLLGMLAGLDSFDIAAILGLLATTIGGGTYGVKQRNKRIELEKNKPSNLN